MKKKKTVSANNSSPSQPLRLPGVLPLKRGGDRVSALAEPETRKRVRIGVRGRGRFRRQDDQRGRAAGGSLPEVTGVRVWPRSPPTVHPQTLPRQNKSPILRSLSSRVSSAFLPARTISGRALERRPETANRRSRIPLTANHRCDRRKRCAPKHGRGGSEERPAAGKGSVVPRGGAKENL